MSHPPSNELLDRDVRPGILLGIKNVIGVFIGKLFVLIAKSFGIEEEVSSTLPGLEVSRSFLNEVGMQPPGEHLRKSLSSSIIHEHH